MSAVERLEDRHDPAMPSGEAPAVEAASPLDVALNPASAGRAARLRPLLALAPYVARYRGRVTLAFISLTIAAITTQKSGECSKVCALKFTFITATPARSAPGSSRIDASVRTFTI